MQKQLLTLLAILVAPTLIQPAMAEGYVTGGLKKGVKETKGGVKKGVNVTVGGTKKGLKETKKFFKKVF